MKMIAVGLSIVAVGFGWLPSSWRHNPGERTKAGIEAWERGDHEAAASALDEALTATGDDATATHRFNAASGRLGAGNLEGALELLGPETTEAPDGQAPMPENDEIPSELQTDWMYNLGNARLESQDPQAAIDAYRQSLLADPDRLDAKHNLELALRQLQEQEQQQQDEQEESEDENEQQDEQEQQQEPDQDEGEQEQEQPQQPDQSELDEFDPQDDMTPEQAASLLEAVENLEREQRRLQADEERQRQAESLVENDW